MTTGAIVFTVILSLFKLLVTCLPNDAVKWITKKFDLHPELLEAHTTASYNGVPLSAQETASLVNQFNSAQFLKPQHIFAGNEDLFLHPESGVVPIIIDTKQNKKNVRLYLFGYSDTIDVVKQYKKKTYAYTLSSEQIQSYYNVEKASFSEEEVQFEPTA